MLPEHNTGTVTHLRVGECTYHAHHHIRGELALSCLTIPCRTGTFVNSKPVSQRVSRKI
jgi:hypothetical protein